MSKQTTGEFMATLRKAHGYTQQEVSEKLNISNRTLSSWETDRTLPDILMLPAIADLYGVSVDELLRGEKRNDDKTHTENVISEKSMNSVYKNKFGAFCTKNTLILGLAIMCASLFVLGCALASWTYAPAWLDWLLLILGIAGVCACCAVAAYQYCNVKTSVGAIFDEDLTADKKAFVTALRHKLEIFIFCCAIPFALFGLILLIYFLATNPQNKSLMGLSLNVRYVYIVFICLNFAFAAILCTAYFIIKGITVKTYYGETQKETAKINRKLIGRLSIFGAIPVVLVIVLNIVLAVVFPKGQDVLYRCDNLDAFRTHMQTIIIDEYDSSAADGHLPAGEYYLAFPYGNPQSGYYEQPQTGIEYDLGNGFYGTYNEPYIESYVHGESWSVYYGKAEDNSSYYLGNLYVYEIGSGDYVVNARYEEDDHVYYANGDLVFKLNASVIYGQYSFSKDASSTLNRVAAITLSGAPSLTLLICGIIYAIKHKKQKYVF